MQRRKSWIDQNMQQPTHGLLSSIFQKVPNIRYKSNPIVTNENWSGRLYSFQFIGVGFTIVSTTNASQAPELNPTAMNVNFQKQVSWGTWLNKCLLLGDTELRRSDQALALPWKLTWEALLIRGFQGVFRICVTEHHDSFIFCHNNQFLEIFHRREISIFSSMKYSLKDSSSLSSKNE